MTNVAQDERRRLADLFAEVGPDAPTLCEGWETRDLAAHLVLREGRPDGAIGVIVSPLSGYTDKVQGRIADRPWDQLVSTVRSGPPRWSPMRLGPVDRLANTIEFFVHHEDVRRAQPSWEPRDLSAEAREALHAALARAIKLLARKVPVGLELVPTDGGAPITAKRGEPLVTASGPIGELVLFVYGRTDHAHVTFDGTDDAVAAVRSAEFGV